MRAREHEAVVSKGDVLQVDPRLLAVKPGFNVRDLDSPDERDDLDELKEQIRGVGVQQPLVVRLVGEELIIVSGHRRHKVVLELINEGEPIAAVPAIQEQKGTDDAERILNLKRMNSGKPLTRLQDAEIVRRLVGYGWDHAKIARGMGWKSASSVSQALALIAMPTEVKTLVTDGKVSATVAASAIKEHGPEFAQRLIQENFDENRKIKGKRRRATPSGIQKAAEQLKPKPAPQPEPPAQEPQPESEAPMPAASPPPADPVHVEQPFPASPPRSVLNGFYAAIQPIARCLELMNFDEIADDEPVSIEIMGRDAKQFSAAWLKATGGES